MSDRRAEADRRHEERMHLNDVLTRAEERTAARLREHIADRVVAEARRDIHESLVGLHAWDADKVREQLHRLEAAVARQTRAKVASELRATKTTLDGLPWNERAARIANPDGEQQ